MIIARPSSGHCTSVKFDHNSRPRHRNEYGLTVAKATAGLGGMFQVDSPLTFAVLIAAAAYAVVAVGLALLLPRH